MPIEDETFYNILGEEISRTSLVQMMIDYYQTKLEIGETKVTDFNEGSEIRNLLESFAVDIYNVLEDQNDLSSIAFIETADGEWLDKHGAMPQIRLERDLGQEATGYVEFKIPTPAETEIIIPMETILSCEENGLDYSTNADAIIGIGETSVLVSVNCLTTGEDGNCAKNTLNTINDNTINISGLTVTNPEKFEYGTDYEEDDEYRERLLAYERKNDFGSLPYYQELGDNVEGVHDIYISDKTSGYTKTITINSINKPITDEIILNVIETFTDVNNVIVDHIFNFESATEVPIALDIDVDVNEEIENSEIINFLTTLFNGGEADQGTELEGLYIGETLRKEQIESILEIIEDIIQINSLKYYDGNDWVDFDVITPSEYEILVFDENSSNITQNIING